jgi:phage terminase large subunit
VLLNPEEKLAIKYRNNATAFSQQVVGDTLEPYQIKVMDAVPNQSRIIVTSCHNLGKTFLASRIVHWAMSNFEGCKLLTTAPTMRQVRDLLWSEIRAGHRDSKYPLGGEMQTVSWRIAEDWFAIGLKPKDEAGGSLMTGQGTASSFQGFHSRSLTVLVFDEATGVQPPLYMQAEGMMTSANVLWVLILNPTSKSSKAYECFCSPLWHKIKLTCFDSPNLIANGITNLAKLEKECDYLKTLDDADKRARINSYEVVKGYLLTCQWVMGRALEWGIDHPLFLSKCLGEFPDEDEYALMPAGVVERAQYRDKPEHDYSKDFTTMGVDVARYGTDKSVITVIQGVVVDKPITLMKRSVTSVAGEVMNKIRDLPRLDVICVDCTGIGSGVFDILLENQERGLIDGSVEIRECHFGQGFTEGDSLAEEDKKKYANLKAKIFVLLGDDIKALLCLPDESVYLKELPTILYKFDSKGKYVIESKENYKKRTGMDSPDHSDSLALANSGRAEVRSVGDFTKLAGDSRSVGEGTIAGGMDGGGNDW